MSYKPHSLTEENYFSPAADLQYTGASQFKAIYNCELDGLLKALHLVEEEESESLLQGSYVDAHFSGTLGLFKRKHPELFSTRTGDLLAKYEKCNTAIARIERDKFLMELMSGEKQVIMVGEIAGVPVKIKIDSFLPGKMIVDEKYMKDTNGVWQDGGKVHFIEAWGYHTSMAIYQEIVWQNTGKRLPVAIIGATKEEVPDIFAFSIAQNVLDDRLDLVTRYIPQYASMKKAAAGMTLEQVLEMKLFRCEKCDNCKNTKVITELTDYEMMMI